MGVSYTLRPTTLKSVCIKHLNHHTAPYVNKPRDSRDNMNPLMLADAS